MIRAIRSGIAAFWQWAQHVDRAVYYADPQAGRWRPVLRALPGNGCRSPWQIRLWWMTLFLPLIGIVMIGQSAIGEGLWRGVVGVVMTLGGPLISWKTARAVYGEAWEATKQPRG